MRLKIQLSFSKVIVSNGVWTGQDWVSGKCFQVIGLSRNIKMESYQKGPNYVHWLFSHCVGLYSQDVRAGKNIWDGLSTSPFLMLFFSRSTSFFSPLPKSHFKAANIEWIKQNSCGWRWERWRGRNSSHSDFPVALGHLCWAHWSSLTLSLHRGDAELDEGVVQPGTCN